MSQRRRIHAPLAVVAVAVGAALLVSCSNSNTIPQAGLRELIQTNLSEELGYPLTNASCPEVKDPETGTTFQCTATLEGQTIRIDAEVTDASTNFVVVQNADAIIVVSLLEDTIATDFTSQAGVEITVDCGDTEVIVAAPATQLQCTASDATDDVTVLVQVQDAEGNITYTAE